MKRPNAVLSKLMPNSTDKSKVSNGCMQEHKSEKKAALFLQNKKVSENKPFNARKTHFFKRENATKKDTFVLLLTSRTPELDYKPTAFQMYAIGREAIFTYHSINFYERQMGVWGLPQKTFSRMPLSRRSENVLLHKRKACFYH